jgi:hypothetical protein
MPPPPPPACKDDATERAAILEIKKALDPNGSILKAWTASACHCTWAGVACASGFVVNV